MSSDKTLEHIEWPLLVHRIISFCKNGPAVEVINSLSPLSPEEAKERLAYISELKELTGISEGPDTAGLEDISTLIEKAGKGGVLSIEDLLSIRRFLVLSGNLSAWMKKHSDENPVIGSELSRTAGLHELSELITGSVTETGDLYAERYPELKRIRDRIRETSEEAEKELLSIIYNPANDKALQEKIFTSRNERYTVLVKAGMKGRIKGRVQDFSASGATLFIEPDTLIPLNDRLIMLDRELKDEILRILKKLSAAVGGCGDEIENNISVYSYLSAVEALARFSAKTLSSPPEITDQPVLRLIKARHPLLHLMIPDTIVANDIELGVTFDCLIISGANTGGKTALLKTAGLCAHMAACGIHIPADPDSKVGIFSKIMADIGDDQDISESLSTFSGQVAGFNRMLKYADSSTLILIDEIMAGTNPDEGTLLAAAVLEALADSGAKIMVATHYPGLKELQSEDSRFMNASVVFDSESMKPVYRLNTGLPGLSYAFEIAENCGLPGDIIARARAMKDDSGRSVDSLLERAARRDKELTEELERVSSLRLELEREKSLLEEKQRELKEKARKINRAEANSFIESLEKTKERIQAMLKELEIAGRDQLAAAAGDIDSAIGEVRGRLRKEARVSAEEKYPAVKDDGLAEGDRVFIVPLEKTGTVEEVDSRKKRARVLFGSSIRSFFSFSDLLIRDKAADIIAAEKKPPRIKTPAPSSAVSLTVQTSYNTIDLRGRRVEEGLRFMESQLDSMTRTGVPAAVIIHGHGTGAMKEAVRSALNLSPYCGSSRPGEQSEGGDGVTIACLNN